MDLVVGVSSNAAKSLVSKLGSLLAAEYTLIRGVRDDIQFINDELESMHAFLILLKRAKSRNEQRLGWMKQVREVAYDIEDCIDDVNHRLVREPRNGRLLYLRKKWYLLTTLYARHCIATEIGNLRVRAQHVSDRRERYGVENPGSEDGGGKDASDAPRDRPASDPRIMCIKKPVGIDVAMADLKDWFDINKTRYRAIVGNGGLGKTTLAMALYRELGDQYHCRAFVLVSQDFNLSALLRNLIKQFNEQQAHASKKPLSGIEEWEDEALKKELKEQVQGKRYLILANDIRSVPAWEKIKDSLPTVGGTIVVTTRFSSVAAASCSHHDDDKPYKHHELSDDPRIMCIKEPVSMDVAMEDLKDWLAVKNQDLLEKTMYKAIVGSGGLGKTTLALALYRKFGDQYDCRVSVPMSQKFNLSALLRNLIKQFNEQQAHDSKKPLNGIEEGEEEALKKELKEQLEGKRYLILVDDIWSVSAWEKIKDSLPTVGGTIVVTTRFSSVAAACGSHHDDDKPYQHSELSEESSYRLFSETISSADELCACVKTFLQKYCRGLPLAIVLVAGLVGTKLKSNQGSKLSEHVVEVNKALSEKLGSKANTEVVTQALLEHCYEDLPVDLKTCLLYMSMFPKGRSISRRRLMRRWIAEGFIIEKNGMTMEEVAEDCFDELISRNLIWAFSYSSNGKVKNYQIHDMVLQYIVSKSSDENFITVVGGHWQTSFPSCKVRRLSVHRSAREDQEILESMKLSHVRSLTVLESFKPLHSCLLKFRILQVLDLECCKDLLPHHLKKICKMYQLKYLSLRRTNISEIPPEISCLEYLEVLDIRETEVIMLPTSADRLKRMAHLHCGDKSKGLELTLTEQITRMKALETLSGIEICGSSNADMTKSMRTRGDGHGLLLEPPRAVCHNDNDGGWYSRKRTKFGQKVADRSSSKEVLEALQILTHLKKLSIHIHGKFEDESEKLLLSAIEHLSSCSLKFLAIDDDFTNFLDTSLNSSKAPPEHLHTLELSGMLSNVPSWITRLDSLKKLTLSLTSLRTDTLKTLAGLHQLFSLTFSLDATKSNHPKALCILRNNLLSSEGEIFVPAGGFHKLQLLRFLAPVLPPLTFQKGAMAELQRLELKFRISNGIHGLENLRLQQVFLGVSRMELHAAEQIKQLAREIVNGPTLIIDEYNGSSEQ